MDQSAVIDATPGTRRWLRVVRPLLLLGGFVALWVTLATGTAHADDGHGPLHTTTQSVAGTVDHSVSQPLRHVVKHESHTIRSAPAPASKPAVATTKKSFAHLATTTHVSPRATVQKSTEKLVAKADRTVRRHTPAVRSAAKAAFAQKPLAPVLDTTRTTVHTQIAPVLDQVRHLRDLTPLVSALTVGTLPTLATTASALPIVEDAETVATAGGGPSAAPSPATILSDLGIDAGHSSAALEHAVQASPTVGVHTGPAQPGPGNSFDAVAGGASATVQSGSGSVAPAAVAENGLVLVAVGSSTSASAFAAAPPTGPAYPPTALPD